MAQMLKVDFGRRSLVRPSDIMRVSLHGGIYPDHGIMVLVNACRGSGRINMQKAAREHLPEVVIPCDPPTFL